MNSSHIQELEAELSANKRLVSVRCPECLTAYSVDISVISNTKPEFDCLKCKSVFWFPLSAVENIDTFIGFLKEEDASSHDKSTESSQPSAPPKMALELDKLGADPFVEDDSRAHLLASDDIKDAWEAVVQRFESQTSHDHFVKLCVAENNLEFAASKYGLIKKTIPGDEMVNRMIGQIEGLATARAGVAKDTSSKEILEAGKVGILRNIPWYYLIIACSLALVLIGLSYPTFRNLVGVGVSIFFLTSAFKILLR